MQVGFLFQRHTPADHDSRSTLRRVLHLVNARLLKGKLSAEQQAALVSADPVSNVWQESRWLVQVHAEAHFRHKS